MKNEFRNAYKLAEYHREMARDMRARGWALLDGDTPDDFDRIADRIEHIEDRVRGLSNVGN